MKFDWSDKDAQDKLRRLWALTNPQMSTLKIAAEFGLTKGAIIGATRRLDLPPRPSPLGKRDPNRVAKPRVPAANKRRVDVNAPPAAPTPPPMPSIAIRRRAAPPRPGDMCCWPIGDPATAEFRFCGEPSRQRGATYCLEHHALAYIDKTSLRREPATLADVEAYAAEHHIVPPIASGLQGFLVAANNHRRTTGQLAFTIAGKGIG